MSVFKKTKVKKDNSSCKKDRVRSLSFVIIAICIAMLLGLLLMMAYRATHNNPEVYRVIVSTDMLPDSLKAYNYMDSEQAKSLINAVIAYDEQLSQKYQYLIEQKEQDNQFFHWGSLIVGIVIAVFGWFGFQSFTTIEDKAKKKASSVAQRVAWTETKKFLNDEGKKEIDKVAQSNLQEETVNKVKDQVISELNSIIENRIRQYIPSSKYDELERRVEILEGSVLTDIEKSVREAVKDVFEKYKRPLSGDSNIKEEKK